MFDGAVAVQFVEVQTRGAEGVDLAFGAEGEGVEDVGEGVAEEGPEAGRGGGLALEVRGRGEDLADAEADAELGHGGFHVGREDVAA